MKEKKHRHGHGGIWFAIILILLLVIWLHWSEEEKEGEIVIVQVVEETVGLSSSNFCGYKGNWIHIRVENDSSYKSLISVCNHEAGHVLFCELEGNCWGDEKAIVGEHYAEVCEHYPRLCLNDERDFLAGGLK